ncbi:unnamed protein product [Menidia menidia]|uniref:(Atlantic silverside) hypothetical protein n=1 Tax=Menidia menidia TaxID=238744 RepID=A0A8S4BSH3_9TELE|nr:unnamed protein product [Menidia menidia]
MDSNKPSLPSKVLQVNSREGNESPLEEMEQRQDSVHGERQRETETRESDVVDGMTTAAETNSHHRGSAEKLKFSTIGHQRRTKQKVVTDFSTLSKGGASGAKPRAALKQVLFSQGVSDKTSEERGQLDALRQELDSFAVPDSLKWRWKEESQGTTLESSWTVLVQSHSTMPKMQKHQQEALWEFVHTELSYINKLKIIQDLVIAALIKLHEQGLLQEVTPKLLFSNLPSILHAHQLFWQEVVFPMLQEVRHSGKPFDPMRLEAGCLQFHERFSVYHDYCWEEEDNLEFARKQMELNPHFHTFIQWVEAHPQCERMRLGDMQAKPHQRITKYPLLLKAILTNTQEPHVEQTLRGMLSSVNGFLGSINDYMQFRDDELALSISAQRVEGYEVEGINEEIDKHVRDICQFNLTCPIKGVGPEVLRKLLLEENLKVRGRKDNKLELVALLFSDVLLLAKVQKKGERLKVFRPPVALDRTQCIPLKDGYSFLLVEIGELQSPVNVLILVPSTSDRCSTWVSTIHEAQKTLKELREQETTRLENLRMREPVTQPKVDDMEMEEQPLMQGKAFHDELSEVLSTSRGINGPEVENNGLPFGNSHNRSSDHKLLKRSTNGHLPEYKGPEWSETRSQEGDENGNQWQEEEKSVMLNHRVQSFPEDQDNFIHHKATDPVRHNRTKPNYFLLEGLPDVDYPTDEESTLQLHNQSQMTKEGFLKPLAERELLIRRDSDLQQDIRRGSWSSQSLDTESPVFTFSKDLKSPKLRRRRPVSTNVGSATPKSEQSFQNSRKIPSVSNSSSNSDSDCNLPFKRNSLPAAFGSDSHRSLKLGSVRQRRDIFQNMHHAASVNSQILPESDLQEMSFQNKKPKLKALRSSSIPNIIIEGSNGKHVQSSYLQASPQAVDTSGSGHDGEIEDKPSNSPLEGFLEKAKERERVKGGVKRDKKLKITNVRSKHLPPPTSFPPTPSPTGGDGGTEWEDVALIRHRGLSVSKGWKEQLVDGDEYDKMSSPVFVDGVNVDWPGWCVDDDEVMDRLTPGDEGLMEGISRSLADFGFNYFSEQEDGECSQV